MGLFLTVACRLSTAGPCHPGVTTRPGMSSITEHQRGFTGIHPSQPSPHLWPPDGTGTLGLFPGLRTPPGRTRRRTPGRGRASALPEVTSSASLTSSDALTHHERHHVAQPLEVGFGSFLAAVAGHHAGIEPDAGHPVQHLVRDPDAGQGGIDRGSDPAWCPPVASDRI
jgi:hypothetical protein